MDFLRRPVFYVIFIIAIVIVGGLTYYSNKKSSSQSTTQTQTPTVSNLSNLDPADFDTEVKNELTLANSKAIEVRPDFKLSMIEVNIDKDLSVNSINTRYIYSSPSDTTNNWVITISASNQSYIRALIPKDDYVGNISSFDIASLKYNYVTALQLAEKAGGLTWREKNTLTGVKLTLKNFGTASQLAWSVEYDANEGTKTINLDATNGKEIVQTTSTDSTTTDTTASQ